MDRLAVGSANSVVRRTEDTLCGVRIGAHQAWAGIGLGGLAVRMPSPRWHWVGRSEGALLGGPAHCAGGAGGGRAIGGWLGLCKLQSDDEGGARALCAANLDPASRLLHRRRHDLQA